MSKCEYCGDQHFVTEVGTQIGTHRKVFLCDLCIDDVDIWDMLSLQELATHEHCVEDDR